MCKMKSIPASKIKVSWAMVDYIPHSVPNWFLLGTLAPMADSEIEPLGEGILSICNKLQ
jgi:hypothetical protein